MKKHTIETLKASHTVANYRETFKTIARVTIAKGMDKETFKNEVEVEFREINDGERNENPLKDAVQYCIAARHVAYMNGVTKEELSAVIEVA